MGFEAAEQRPGPPTALHARAATEAAAISGRRKECVMIVKSEPLGMYCLTRLSQYVIDAAKRLMLNNLLNKLLFDVQPGEFIMTKHVQTVPLDYAYVP